MTAQLRCVKCYYGWVLVACQLVCFDVDYWFSVCGPLFFMWVWFESWCYDLGFGVTGTRVGFVLGYGISSACIYIYEGYLVWLLIGIS